MAKEEHDHGDEGKLRLIKSPIVGVTPAGFSSSPHQQQSSADVESLGYRDGPNHSCPEFQRHEEATNIELFFDLFFAANLTVFSEVHEVTNTDQLTSYIGYFCMLWFTWALVGLFDVRFVTDSIFERIARSGHLGVMVGFAVVAPNFNPSDQIKQTFRTMSIILMVSRLILVIQYGTIIWHVRKYRNTKLPLGVMAGVHFVAAMIYLGITFRFRDYNSRVYIAWYIIAICETLLNIVLSFFWDVLSFQGTHLMSRMTLLTLIIIGEGIIVVATNVTTIVKNPNSWTPATIGVVTSGIATMYIVYQIYFDYMGHLHLPPVRQLIWVFLHFPFHLALTLFVEGASQFVIWWKILEVLTGFSNDVQETFDNIDPDLNVTDVRGFFIDKINETVNDIFSLYPPIYVQTDLDIEASFRSLENISETWWNSDTLGDDEETRTFNESVETIYRTVSNSLFATFKIDAIAETEFDGDGVEFEQEVQAENWTRFRLVFQYAFVCAGLVLILINVLFIASRTKRWAVFDVVRAALNFIVGAGLALSTLVTLNDTAAGRFEETPWLLPTLCLAFFVVLVVNHLPKPPPLFFRRRKEGKEQPGHGGPGLLGGPVGVESEFQGGHAYKSSMGYSNGQYSNVPLDAR